MTKITYIRDRISFFHFKSSESEKKKRNVSIVNFDRLLLNTDLMKLFVGLLSVALLAGMTGGS